MNLTPNEIRLMRKPPSKFVGRDKRAAEALVAKGAFREDATHGFYVMTEAGKKALEAAAPKKDK